MRLEPVKIEIVRPPQEEYLRIYPKGGLFIVSSSAVRNMGLSAGDQVEILQDKDDPRNYYFQINKKGQFKLRIYAGSHGLKFKARSVVYQIFKDNGHEPIGFKGSIKCPFLKPLEDFKMPGGRIYPVVIPEGEGPKAERVRNLEPQLN